MKNAAWNDCPPPRSGLFGLMDTMGRIHLGKYNVTLNHYRDIYDRPFRCVMFTHYRHPSARDHDRASNPRPMGDWQTAR